MSAREQDVCKEVPYRGRTDDFSRGWRSITNTKKGAFSGQQVRGNGEQVKEIHEGAIDQRERG